MGFPPNSIGLIPTRSIIQIIRRIQGLNHITRLSLLQQDNFTCFPSPSIQHTRAVKIPIVIIHFPLIQGGHSYIIVIGIGLSSFFIENRNQVQRVLPSYLPQW